MTSRVYVFTNKYNIQVILISEMSYNINDIEGRLLTVYDPDLIKDLVAELYNKQRWRLADFVNLNDKVRLLFYSLAIVYSLWVEERDVDPW